MASIGDYDIGQLLGRGGFAVVYRARDRKTNADVAVKVIDRAAMLDKGALARIVNEIKVHRLLKHDKIVAMRNCFESDTHIFIVMELCSYGNLFRYLKQHGPLSEQDASTVIRQLLDALDYLHSRGIVHRDLKLSNILLSCDPSQQLHIKVCDFGLAVQLQHPDEEHYTLCGTPNYIAPEVASQQAHSYPADLWSVGCLFYSLVVGSPPFEQGDVKETLRNILSGKYAEPTTLSCSALDFLRKLLHLNPSKRPNVKEILCHQVLNTTQNSNFVGVTGVNHEIVSKFSSQQQQNCDLSPVKETSSHSSASSSISRQPAVVVNHQPEVLVDSIRQPKASTEPSFDSVSASSRIVQKRLNAAAADSVRSSKCISSRISTESCSRSESSMKSQTIPSWLSALSNIRNSRDSFHCSSLANSRRSYDIHSAPFSVNDKRINASFQQLQDRHNLSYCVDSISSYALKSSLDSQSTELKQSSQESCGTIFCNILQAASALQPLVMSPNKKDLLIVDSQQNITFYTRMVKRSYINNTYVAPELKFLKVVISRTKYVDSIQVNPTSSSRNSFSNRTENITSLSGISVHNIDSVEESEVLRLVSICVGDQSNNLRDILSINTNSMRLLPYEEVVGVNSKIRGRENILRCYPFSSQTGLSSSSATQNLSLPKYLARSLSKVHGILSALRATIPRFIMYVAVGVDQCNNRNVHNGSRDSSSSGKMSCKCMLMSNDPLPDFYCQWADGCKIRYCLSTGKLAIEAPTLSLRWEGSMAWNMGSRMPMSKNIMTNDRGYLMNQCEDYSGTEMTEIDSWNTVDSLPSLLNKYVLYAQKALQRCFQEEKKKYYGKKSLEMKKEAVKTKTLSGPSVLVVDRL